MEELRQGITTRPFRRSDTRESVKAGTRIIGGREYILDLQRIGMVREVSAFEGPPETKANPFPAVGAELQSSASPAAQASPQTSAKKSGRGGKRRVKEKPDE